MHTQTAKYYVEKILHQSKPAVRIVHMIAAINLCSLSVFLNGGVIVICRECGVSFAVCFILYYGQQKPE